MTKTAQMQAWIFDEVMHMTLSQVPKPECTTENDALVRITAAGICGSDMHAWHGHDQRRRPPLILGHEVAGVVEQAPGSWAGKRVALNPMITCATIINGGRCRYCTSGRENICGNRGMIGMTLPGGFAEYVTLPHRCLLEIPAGLSDLDAALCEPVAVCVHGVNLARRFCSIQSDATKNGARLEDSRILIIGAGAIGLMTALILQSENCTDLSICDMNALRVQTAAESGFTGEVINNQETPIEPRNYDIIFDAVGSAKTRQAAIDALADGGAILHLGLQEPSGEFDARRLTIGEIAFFGVFTYTQADLRQALALLGANKLNTAASWLQARPFEAGQDSFEQIHRATTPAAKIVLRL